MHEWGFHVPTSSLTKSQQHTLTSCKPHHAMRDLRNVLQARLAW